LHGVTETLLGRKQDCPLSERKLAEPEPAAVAAAHIGHAGALPAPLVFGKASLQLSEREQ
jgi:hypothetical protein